MGRLGWVASRASAAVGRALTSLANMEDGRTIGCGGPSRTNAPAVCSRANPGVVPTAIDAATTAAGVYIVALGCNVALELSRALGVLGGAAGARPRAVAGVTPAAAKAAGEIAHC
mmetsp:Transcript_34276/g.87217  ORF Transcript_34276/g.87217 Transcript_34276/m.87217 type:complete len:115 (+) Transcript_34276:583-927(+)